MNTILINSADKLSQTILKYYQKDTTLPEEIKLEFQNKTKEAETKNPWFTQDNIQFALLEWAELLKKQSLENWLKTYNIQQTTPKKIGLILAGNIPMVGFHDILSVILTGHHAIIKLSSKDTVLIPFILKLWQNFSKEKINYTIVEKIQNINAVIATGSNNTAQYLQQYFKNIPHIIRKNRTSIAILKENETNQNIQKLSKDIFTYFGMGCRNVTKIFMPQNFNINQLFENFITYANIINHNQYANNYDYNKAIFLLNQDKFWDNNFIMLRENENLFSPISVIHYTRYKNTQEIETYITKQKENIQTIVSSIKIKEKTQPIGNAQKPTLNNYPDNIDTIKFLKQL